MGGDCSTYGERRGLYRVLVAKRRGNDSLRDLDVDGMIILRLICRKWGVGEWTASSWLRIGTVGRHL